MSASLPSHIARSISREEINDLPIQRYDGPVHLVASDADLQRAMADISQTPVVGFDTETRPAFRPGESYLPSLVQLATAHAVYLLQIQQRDFSVALREFFASESTIKVGVAVNDDLRNLQKLVEFDARAMVDLGNVAKRHGLRQTGVRSLAAIFLGFRIAKGAKTTNWSARRLTPQQIAYAATDAWVCRELYLRFEALDLV